MSAINSKMCVLLVVFSLVLCDFRGKVSSEERQPSERAKLLDWFFRLAMKTDLTQLQKNPGESPLVVARLRPHEEEDSYFGIVLDQDHPKHPVECKNKAKEGKEMRMVLRGLDTNVVCWEMPQKPTEVADARSAITNSREKAKEQANDPLTSYINKIKSQRAQTTMESTTEEMLRTSESFPTDELNEVAHKTDVGVNVETTIEEVVSGDASEESTKTQPTIDVSKEMVESNLESFAEEISNLENKLGLNEEQNTDPIIEAVTEKVEDDLKTADKEDNNNSQGRSFKGDRGKGVTVDEVDDEYEYESFNEELNDFQNELAQLDTNQNQNADPIIQKSTKGEGRSGKGDDRGSIQDNMKISEKPDKSPGTLVDDHIVPDEKDNSDNNYPIIPDGEKTLETFNRFMEIIEDEEQMENVTLTEKSGHQNPNNKTEEYEKPTSTTQSNETSSDVKKPENMLEKLMSALNGYLGYLGSKDVKEFKEIIENLKHVDKNDITWDADKLKFALDRLEQIILGESEKLKSSGDNSKEPMVELDSLNTFIKELQSSALPAARSANISDPNSNERLGATSESKSEVTSLEKANSKADETTTSELGAEAAEKTTSEIVVEAVETATSEIVVETGETTSSEILVKAVETTTPEKEVETSETTTSEIGGLTNEASPGKVGKTNETISPENVSDTGETTVSEIVVGASVTSTSELVEATSKGTTSETEGLSNETSPEIEVGTGKTTTSEEGDKTNQTTSSETSGKIGKTSDSELGRLSGKTNQTTTSEVGLDSTTLDANTVDEDPSSKSLDNPRKSEISEGKLVDILDDWKTKFNYVMYCFIAFMILFLIIIAVLLYRLNRTGSLTLSDVRTKCCG